MLLELNLCASIQPKFRIIFPYPCVLDTKKTRSLEAYRKNAVRNLNQNLSEKKTSTLNPHLNSGSVELCPIKTMPLQSVYYADFTEFFFSRTFNSQVISFRELKIDETSISAVQKSAILDCIFCLKNSFKINLICIKNRRFIFLFTHTHKKIRLKDREPSLEGHLTFSKDILKSDEEQKQKATKQKRLLLFIVLWIHAIFL